MRINSFFEVHQGEWGKVVLLFAHMSLVASILVIIQSTTSALFLETYNPELLPYLYSIQAVFFVLLSLVHSSVLAGLDQSTGSTYAIVILAVAVVVSRLLYTLHYSWSIFALYVLLQSFVDILFIVCSGMVIAHLNVRESRRLFSLINVGGTAGSIVSGVIVACLASKLGTENLLLMVIPLLGAMIMTGKWITQHDDHHKVRPSGEKFSGSADSTVKKMTKGVVGIFSDKMLLLIAVMVLSGIIASTIVDYQLKSSLKANFNKDEITVFLGELFTVLNVTTLALQLFASGKIMSSLGLTLNLLLMPFFILIGSVVFVFMPSVWVVTGTRFLENVTKLTVYKSSSSLLFMPYPPLLQTRFKIAVDGIIKPVAIVLASLLMVSCSGLLELRYLSLISALAATVAVIAIFRIKKLYLEKLKDSLSNRGIRLQDTMEMGDLMRRKGYELTQRLMKAREKQEILFCLQLAREYDIPLQVELLHEIGESKDEVMSVELLRTIQQDGNPQHEKWILSLLTNAPGAEVAAECMKTLRYLKVTDYDENRVAVFADSGNERVQAEVRLLVASCAGGYALDELVNELMISVQNAPVEKLSSLLYMMGETGDARLAGFLPPLFTHVERGVRMAALAAAGKIYAPDSLPVIVPAVVESESRFPVTHVLAFYGKDAVDELCRLFARSTGNESFRVSIVAILGKLRTRYSHEALLRLLSPEDKYMRKYIIMALCRFIGTVEVVPRYRSRLMEVVKDELRVGAELHALQYAAHQAVKHDTGKAGILQDEITCKLNEWKEYIFKILLLLYNPVTIKKAYYNCIGYQKEHHANSMELLENLLDHDINKYLIPLIENMPDVTRFSKLGRVPEFRKTADKEWPVAFAESSFPWLTLMAGWIESTSTQVTVSTIEATMHNSLETIFFLKGLELFSSLSGEQLKPVAELLTKVEFVADTVIFREGDAGDGLYLMVSGEVKVQNESREIAVLKKGDFFGEMALLEDAPRSATVIATTECELLKMDKEDFYEVLAEYPSISRAIIRTLAKRLRALL